MTLPNEAVAAEVVLGDPNPAPAETPPAETPPAAEPKPVLDAEGNPILDAEGKPTFEAPPAPDGKAPVGAPEKYAEFKTPEGMPLNADLLGAFSPIAKEMNLSQENAQKLVDLYATAVGTINKEQQSKWQDIQKGWLDEAKKDPEIGGANFQKNCQIGMKAILKFGDPGLQRVIMDFGLGQNPSMIRFFAKVGRTVMEDVPPAGGATPPAGNPLETLYPTMFTDKK